MISAYLSTTTWLHRIRPGVKLGVLAALSILLLPSTSLWIHAPACLAATSLFLSLGDPGKRRLRELFKSAGLLAVMIGLFQFLFGLGDMGAGQAGWHALVSVLRLLSLILLADLVSITTPLTDLLAVVETLLKPLRVLSLSTRPLSLSIGLMIRVAGLMRQRLDFVTQSLRMKSPKRPGLRVIGPLIRQMGHSNVHLAEALYARRLRRQASDQ